MRIHRFLVIDSYLDNGALLVRTLSRKFPNASIQLLRHDAEALRALSGGEAVAAIVLHRTDESDAVALIHAFKAAAPQVPIVAVSGVDRSEALLRAGRRDFSITTNGGGSAPSSTMCWPARRAKATRPAPPPPGRRRHESPAPPPSPGRRAAGVCASGGGFPLGRSPRVRPAPPPPRALTIVGTLPRAGAARFTHLSLANPEKR